jgi:16S rRNA (adenine1518-N6/adenine1519-N6)-dimethyltransferase
LQADALRTNIKTLWDRFDIGDNKLHIISNLPYNIGTELLTRWVHDLNRIASLTLMFQKEVAMRIEAPVGCAAYGRLSVLIQNICSVDTVMDLSPSAFTPAPKVDSRVIHLRPLNTYDQTLPYLHTLETLTRVAFSQRRKQIKGPLKALFGDQTEIILTAHGISPSARAEQIHPHLYMDMAKTMALNDRANGFDTVS